MNIFGASRSLCKSVGLLECYVGCEAGLRSYQALLSRELHSLSWFGTRGRRSNCHFAATG